MSGRDPEDVDVERLDALLQLALADWADGHEPALAEALAEEVRELSEQLVPAMTLALPETEPPAALRERLLASAARPAGRFAPFIARLARLIDRSKTHAAELLERIARDAADTWESAAALGPGIELVHLEGGPAVAGADVGFVRMPGGARFPMHEHLGSERVLILQGRLRDDDGRIYGPGDAAAMEAGSKHEFSALPGPPLIYAVVVHGMRFPGIPGALDA